jgi:hypothetical protein
MSAGQARPLGATCQSGLPSPTSTTPCQIEALQRLATEGAIPARSARRILEDNPGRLYGIA